MNFQRRIAAPTLAIGILVAIVGAMMALSPAPLSCNATGCTLLENKVYSGGSCFSSFGNSCYRCEVTQGGDTRTCYEAPDPADGSSCPLDERDIPPDPWGH